MQSHLEVTESLSDVINIRRGATTLDASEQFDGYSKVVITVSDDVEFTSGTDSGRTLTLECPWGTQKMADDILAKIRGYQYQPYTAGGAILDPAAELGDGVSIGSVYGGLYKKDITLNSLYTADISAPSDEKINNEFPFKSASERKVSRELYNLSSELKIQAGLISAEVEERKSAVETLNAQLVIQANEISTKVSKTGGNSSSFGWTLTDSSWTVYSNGSAVLTATSGGLEVAGKIVARSGQIGGFNITSNSLSYNNMTWGGTNSSGIYIGPSGIQLGKNFKVDSSGNLTAASGTFTGYVRAGNIQYGGSAGYFSGDGLSSGSVYGGSGGKISGGSISTYNTSGGINTSLGYADYAYNVVRGITQASHIITSRLTVGNYSAGWQTIRYVNSNGSTSSVRVLTGQ